MPPTPDLAGLLALADFILTPHPDHSFNWASHYRPYDNYPYNNYPTCPLCVAGFDILLSSAHYTDHHPLSHGLADHYNIPSHLADAIVYCEDVPGLTPIRWDIDGKPACNTPGIRNTANRDLAAQRIREVVALLTPSPEPSP